MIYLSTCFLNVFLKIQSRPFFATLGFSAFLWIFLLAPNAGADDSALQALGKAKEKYYEKLHHLGKNATVAQKIEARKSAFAEAKQSFDKEASTVQSRYLQEGAKALLRGVSAGTFPDIRNESSGEQTLSVSEGNHLNKAASPEIKESEQRKISSSQRDRLQGEGAAGATTVDFGSRQERADSLQHDAQTKKLNVVDGIIQNH